MQNVRKSEGRNSPLTSAPGDTSNPGSRAAPTIGELADSIAISSAAAALRARADEVTSSVAVAGRPGGVFSPTQIVSGQFQPMSATATFDAVNRALSDIMARVASCERTTYVYTGLRGVHPFTYSAPRPSAGMFLSAMACAGAFPSDPTRPSGTNRNKVIAFLERATHFHVSLLRAYCVQTGVEPVAVYANYMRALRDRAVLRDVNHALPASAAYILGNARIAAQFGTPYHPFDKAASAAVDRAARRLETDGIASKAVIVRPASDAITAARSWLMEEYLELFNSAAPHSADPGDVAMDSLGIIGFLLVELTKCREHFIEGVRTMPSLYDAVTSPRSLTDATPSIGITRHILASASAIIDYSLDTRTATWFDADRVKFAAAAFNGTLATRVASARGEQFERAARHTVSQFLHDVCITDPIG